MDKVFLVIGMAVAAWWICGVLILCFAKSVYVAPGTPLAVKAQVVALSGFVLPWLYLTVGQVPGMMIAPADPTPEEEEAMAKWKKDNCPCPECRARRGEK